MWGTVLNLHTGALCVPLCLEGTFGSQRVLTTATKPLSRAFRGDCPALTGFWQAAICACQVGEVGFSLFPAP